MTSNSGGEVVVASRRYPWDVVTALALAAGATTLAAGLPLVFVERAPAATAVGALAELVIAARLLRREELEARTAAAAALLGAAIALVIGLATLLN